MLIDAFADLPSAADVAALDPAELVALMADLERRRREVEARQVAVLEVVVARGLHRADGHRSAKAWFRSTVNCSAGAGLRRVRTARLAGDSPVVAEAIGSGRLGVEQAHELARAHANPRCGHRLGEVADVLVDAASRLSFEEFRALVRRWEMLADLDGAHGAADRARRNRRAALSLSTFGFHLEAMGPKLEGAAMVDVFQRFCDAEFLADLEAARQAAGGDDDVSLDSLPRTAAQRSFDALFEIFRRAAATPPGSRRPEPLVNVVVDATTLASFLNGDSSGAVHRVGLADLGDVADRRCGTAHGDNLTPADVVLAALWGRIRGSWSTATG